MALHKDFPESPHAVLDPDIRWFPADEALRETSMEKLTPLLVPQLRKKPSWATAHQRITKIACHSEGAKRPKNLLMQGSRDSSPLAQNDTPIELYFRNKVKEFRDSVRSVAIFGNDTMTIVEVTV